MDFGINGKVAMVAAGSQGIGFAVAESLAQEGCKVSICSRTEDGAAKAAAAIGRGAKGYACDVTNADQIVAWFERTAGDLGTPQILVTNTGGPPAGSALDVSDEQWHKGIESTLLNVVRMVRQAVPGMKKAGWGRIVHVTSLVAKEPAKILTISTTLRSGLMSLTKLQAWELAQDGITVNSVLPGHTDTARQMHLIEIRAEKEGIDLAEARRRQEDGTPMKRFANPSEIGDVVAFLCSAKSSYVSGTSLLVDGATTTAVG
jgi:3-oxoacyl-[acyl-carrier protein] reductase